MVNHNTLAKIGDTVRVNCDSADYKEINGLLLKVVHRYNPDVPYPVTVIFDGKSWPLNDSEIEIIHAE